MNIQRIIDTLALNLETIKNAYPKLGEQIVSIRRCIDTTTCTELNVTTTRGVLLICQYLIEDYSIVLQQLHPSIRNYYINRFQCIYKNMQDESLNQKQSTVSMAYRDIVFVICMLHDYLPALQTSNLKHKDWLINIIQDAADNLSNHNHI